MEDQVEPGRRHIIKRPRLTKLLDESNARAILLVAPAGYGKTTLAREWLDHAERSSTIYRAAPASRDVAVLAAGLSRALSTIVPSAGKRMHERLRVTRAPEQESGLLAELLAEDLIGWPTASWLLIDDYHELGPSMAAEEFLERLIDQSPLNVLVTSRVRPRWATTRRLLYQEFFELDKASLAMNQAEASEVLDSSAERSGIWESADGWPAVIAMAALSGRGQEVVEGELPTALYDYFAEELFDSLKPQVQSGLCRLSILPSLTQTRVSKLLDVDADLVVNDSVRFGLLHRTQRGDLELHPLLRTFLATKFEDQDSTNVRRFTDAAADFLLEEGAWDDAFLVIGRSSTANLIHTLIEAALPDLLEGGRLATLQEWLGFARTAGLESPILDLVEAEIEFRNGRHQRSESLARDALTHLPKGHAFISGAAFLTGQSARFEDRNEIALEYHNLARTTARNHKTERQAMWGQFLTLADLERHEATELLEEFAATSGPSIDDRLRYELGKLIVGSYTASLGDALVSSQFALSLIARATDPMIRSSFLNFYGHSLCVNGRYRDGLNTTDLLLEEVDRYRLPFAVPHTYLTRAVAELGLREFKACFESVEHALALDLQQTVFISMNAAIIRAKLALALGDLPRAVAATDGRWTRLPAAGLHAEYLAVRGLSLVASGRIDEGLAATEAAAAASERIEARVLGCAVRSIAALLAEPGGADKAVDALIDTVLVTSDFDDLVAAYRAFPPLLEALASRDDSRLDLQRLMTAANDDALARRVGVLVERSDVYRRSLLSRRETQVLELVGAGLTNKEIGKTLFISDVTVKVHLRHAFRKLGVRSRTEAALKINARPTALSSD